jgi:ribonuclease E
MKKGTEKVIAHLPIECATFLLNEKRSAIEQIENRLKVGIVILPSKHLETPAYDIERIKEKEVGDSKASYLQIKAEDIAIPEFAQQVKPTATKAAVKEFLHDSPAPVQSKNESASLIQRFWHKLVGSKATSKAKSSITQSAGRNKPVADESQANRNKDGRHGQAQNQERGRNRGRGRGGRGQNPKQEQVQVQASGQGQQSKQKPEQNQDSHRANRPPRGQGRNVKRNLDPAAMPIAKIEQVRSDAISAGEATLTEPEFMPTVAVIAAAGEQAKRNNARRGPNRRRPRNPNYKRPETEGDSNTTIDAVSVSNSESRPVGSRSSYDNDFAERAEKVERPQSQANISSSIGGGSQDSEPKKQATFVEPGPAPKPVETERQETE